jgi:hypothetical protein
MKPVSELFWAIKCEAIKIIAMRNEASRLVLESLYYHVRTDLRLLSASLLGSII